MKRQRKREIIQGREPLEPRWLLDASMGADDFPNLPSNEVCLLVEGESIVGQLEVDADVDVFAFDVGQSDVVRFDVASESLRAFRLQVLRDDMPNVAEKPYLRREFGQKLTWIPEEPGRYHLAISSLLGTGTYSLQMSTSEDDRADPTPEIRSLDINKPTKAAFQFPEDVDVFRLDTIEGQGYIIDISRDSIHTYPEMELFFLENQNERLVARSLPFSTSNPEPSFHFLATTNTYFLRLTSLRRTALGAYQIHLESPMDDAPNLPSVDAPLLEFEKPKVGSFEVEGDIDVFAFDVVAGEHYEIRTGTGRGTARPGISFISETGEPLGAFGLSPAVSARHYVRVRGGVGTYELTIARMKDFTDAVQEPLPSLIPDAASYDSV